MSSNWLYCRLCSRWRPVNLTNSYFTRDSTLLATFQWISWEIYEKIRITWIDDHLSVINSFANSPIDRHHCNVRCNHLSANYSGWYGQRIKAIMFIDPIPKQQNRSGNFHRNNHCKEYCTEYIRYTVSSIEIVPIKNTQDG